MGRDSSGQSFGLRQSARLEVGPKKMIIFILGDARGVQTSLLSSRQRAQKQKSDFW
jgi:hypothetical protein